MRGRGIFPQIINHRGATTLAAADEKAAQDLHIVAVHLGDSHALKRERPKRSSAVFTYARHVFISRLAAHVGRMGRARQNRERTDRRRAGRAEAALHARPRRAAARPRLPECTWPRHAGTWPHQRRQRPRYAASTSRARSAGSVMSPRAACRRSRMVRRSSAQRATSSARRTAMPT